MTGSAAEQQVVLVADLLEDVEEFYAGFAAGDFNRVFRIFAETVVTVEPTLGRAAGLNVWREYDEAFKAQDSFGVLPFRRVSGSRLRVRCAARSQVRCAPRSGSCSQRGTCSTCGSRISSSSARAESSSITSTTTSRLRGPARDHSVVMSLAPSVSRESEKVQASADTGRYIKRRQPATVTLIRSTVDGAHEVPRPPQV